MAKLALTIKGGNNYSPEWMADPIFAKISKPANLTEEKEKFETGLSALQAQRDSGQDRKKVLISYHFEIVTRLNYAELLVRNRKYPEARAQVFEACILCSKISDSFYGEKCKEMLERIEQMPKRNIHLRD